MKPALCLVAMGALVMDSSPQVRMIRMIRVERGTNDSGKHRIRLRKLELSLEILETSVSMNPVDSPQPKASSHFPFPLRITPFFCCHHLSQ